jgi:predicted nucleotidyltransferase
MTTIELINAALATVSDPELHRPLPELGMVESVAVNGATAELKILLTISGCPMQDRLRSDITAAVIQVAEIDEVKTAFVFGSYAKGNQTNDSDIDILIELKNKNKFSYFDLLELKHQIELSIGITVDIGFYKGLKGNLNELVEPTLIKIYECRN